MKAAPSVSENCRSASVSIWGNSLQGMCLVAASDSAVMFA